VPKTSRDPFEDVLDRAFEISSSLTRVRCGPFTLDIHANGPARPYQFEAALLETTATPTISAAVIVGSDPVLERALPEPAGLVHLIGGDRFLAHWLPAPESILSIYDRQTARGLTWFPKEPPAWAVGQPFVPIIHAAAHGTNWCVVHAAAVGRGGRFLLLAGPGRSGKSTAALACVRAGYDYAGDDLVLVDPQQRRVEALFASARVRESGVSEFKEMVARSTFAVTDDEGASRYELRLDIEPRSGTVAAILLPERTGSAPFVFRPARGAEVVKGLLRHSLARSPGYAATTASKVLGAARMAPAFIVDTGSDPRAIPPAFDEFLAGLR
jgi:hypothetical protein